jgi:dipeptidyl aminopeptidase/acylaminoacyl peptidase
MTDRTAAEASPAGGAATHTVALSPSAGLRPADLHRIVTVSTPAVAPDGRAVAYVVTRMDEPSNRYRSNVWLASAEGGFAPRQLTEGPGRDSIPAWSPDGRLLAFARSHRAAGAEAHELCVLWVGQGDVRVVASPPEAVERLCWSPSGDQLCFESRVPDPRYSAPDAAAQPPRKIDRLFPRRDGVGWTIDRPSQLFVIDLAAAGSPRQLTSGPHEATAPAWSPDGRSLVFVSARQDDADLQLENDLWLIDAAAPAAEAVRLTATDAVVGPPSFSPDGESLAYLERRGPRGAGAGHRHAQLVVLDLRTGERRTLTRELDRNCTLGDQDGPPVWCGDTLLVGIEDHGSVPILAVSVANGIVQWITEGERQVTGMHAAGGAVAYTATTVSRPTELFIRIGGREQQLTHHQRAFLDRCPPVGAERFAVLAENGDEVDAWLMRPPDFDPDRTYPCLLNIHGGCNIQYGHRWFDEFQLYTSAGFVVLFSNPHGSTGDTEAFARSIQSPVAIEDPGTGWGALDYSDLMRVMDDALSRYPFIDPRRLGVMGGSYGGWATSWIVAHTDRFAAACSERALNNRVSAEWSADLAGLIRHETGLDPLTQLDELWRISPMRYVRDIETPLMIIHSDEDLRCEAEQADGLWVALRSLGKTVEYWRFPGEGHEMSRSGSPAHRRQRAELIIDWFRRQL